MPFDDNGTWYDDSTAGQNQPSADQNIPTPSPDFYTSPMPDTSFMSGPSSADSISTYLPIVSSILGLDSANSGWSAGGASQSYFGGGPMGGTPSPAVSGTGPNNATTGTGDKGFIGGLLDSFKSSIGWDSMKPSEKAGVMTVGAGLISGIGSGYMAQKKMDQQQKLIDAQTLLAQTQAQIAQERAANQNMSALKFNQPLDSAGRPIGLINRTAKLTPISQRGAQ